MGVAPQQQQQMGNVPQQQQQAPPPQQQQMRGPPQAQQPPQMYANGVNYGYNGGPGGWNGGAPPHPSQQYGYPQNPSYDPSGVSVPPQQQYYPPPPQGYDYGPPPPQQQAPPPSQQQQPPPQMNWELWIFVCCIGCFLSLSLSVQKYLSVYLKKKNMF
jgi:hypothetical protein